MSKAVLVIDYSNDFIDDKGALTCAAAGQAIDGAIYGLVKEILAEDGFVFVCNDRHQPNDSYHPESRLFPPHNLADTWGENLYGQTGKLLRQLLEEKKEQTIYLPKLWFSAFQDTPLDWMLRARKVDTLVVCGVCTDICVLHTVIAACYLGYRVQVKKDACATIIAGGQEWALQHMANCLGVELI